MYLVKFLDTLANLFFSRTHCAETVV